MDLPVMPPVQPMLAKSVDSLDKLPPVPGMFYEPKWDGFRCIAFRDGDEIVLGSRNDRPLTRYFPEVADALRSALPDRIVVDGEIVIATDHGLDFEALQLRLHPAESRVRMLAEKTPASFVAFDLLALDDRSLLDDPLSERRAVLVDALAGVQPPVHLTPTTTDPAIGADWFTRFEGAGFDGIIAKDPSVPYKQNLRVQWKVKHHRTADAVVAGFRWHKDREGVGSLLLGLYDEDGVLHHVGVCASFSAKFRRELVTELEPLREGALEGHPWQGWAEMQGEGRMPGGQSRWNAGKDLSWEPLRAERVIEIEFDQLQAGRFRRVAHFSRWRPDKTPGECRFDQLDVAIPAELAEVFGA